jgi:hypothetical protein
MGLSILHLLPLEYRDEHGSFEVHESIGLQIILLMARRHFEQMLSSHAASIDHHFQLTSSFSLLSKQHPLLTHDR